MRNPTPTGLLQTAQKFSLLHERSLWVGILFICVGVKLVEIMRSRNNYCGVSYSLWINILNDWIYLIPFRNIRTYPANNLARWNRCAFHDGGKKWNNQLNPGFPQNQISLSYRVVAWPGIARSQDERKLICAKTAIPNIDTYAAMLMVHPMWNFVVWTFRFFFLLE